MPNISGLYTALSGMNAQRRVLDVTAHNVANQATEGYHRQRVDLRAVGVSDVATVFAGQDIRSTTSPRIGRSAKPQRTAEHKRCGQISIR
jgi:flagellar basal body rod protein FlgG